MTKRKPLRAKKPFLVQRRDRRERCPHGNRITPGNDGPCGCRVSETDAALAIECSGCNAPAGSYCVNADGREFRPQHLHKVRTDTFAMQQRLLEQIREHEGLEITDNINLMLAEMLEKRGLITLSAPHGPKRAWRRAEIVIQPQPIHSDRKPWTCRCNSVHAADAEECGRCYDKPPWPSKHFEDAWNKATGALRHQLDKTRPQEFKRIADAYAHFALHPDPPLPPPAPGVEPATSFAERLARMLVYGEPNPVMVVDILKHVRERDAIIVAALKGKP